MPLTIDPLAVLEARLGFQGLDATRNSFNTVEALARIRSTLHGGQIDFFDDITTRELGIAAGYGSGKTLGLCAKAVQLAILNPGVVGCVLEPTGPMLRDIWIRKFDDFLDRFQIPYTFRASPLPEYVLHLPEGDTPVIARSLENFRRIVGPDWAWALADEIDTVQAGIAQRAYEKIVGRIRVGRVNQLGFVSTPEGFGWHYKTFGAPDAIGTLSRRLIRMRSQDNPHLPASYLDSLRERYTGPMLKAYMEGIYVNLTSGQVYDRFSRDHHVRPLADPLQPLEPLIIGVDFNVGNMHAAILVRRGAAIHCIGEVAGAHDTDDLARQLVDRYPGHPMLGYPDASGANRSTNSSLSDIGILEQWGIVNRAPKANPAVRDRVMTMQAMLLNAKGETRLWISPECKHTIECLERQAYNDKGEPDKDNGYDHANDALGYPIHAIFSGELGYSTMRPLRVGAAQWGRGRTGHQPPKDKAERILSRAGW